VAHSDAEARQQLLDELAGATDALAVALSALGEAYELLDDQTADRLEEQLFRPVQAAYGRAKRTHAEFAARHDLPSRAFAPASQGHPSQGVKAFVDGAVAAVGQADSRIATLQDSMLPVEFGDAELRAGLSEVRRQLGDVPGRAREFGRTLGR
jgi:hypothetical protein